MLRSALVLLVLLLPAIALAQNQPPVADAGEDQTVFLGNSILLNGTAIDADEDPIVAWFWEVEGSPPGSNPVLSGEFSADVNFIADLVGDYTLSLIAFDGADWSAPDFVVITYVVNEPPIAVGAATPTSGPAPLTAQFDGTGSVDPEKGPLVYLWEFGDSTPPVLAADPLHVYASPGVYVAELAVQDDAGQLDYDSITITVTEPPQLIDLGDRTRDEATGLDWLDVTQTVSLSYDEILAGAGGWVAAGWRHATLQEVCDFFTTHAVAPADPCGSGSEFYGSDASVVPVQALLGITRALPEVDDTFGFVDNGTAGPDVGIAELRFSGGSVSIAGVDSDSSSFDRTSASPNVGHFLVRPYAPVVPSFHPLALYTLVPGLLVGVGLAVMRIRD